MDIISLMSPLAVLAAAFTCYVFVYHRTNKRKCGFYTNPDWNFFLKKWWAVRQLEERKKNERKCLEGLSEDPIPLKNEESSEWQIFYATDQEGNSILIRYARYWYKNVDVWLVLRLKDGTVWTLPQHPDTKVRNVNTGKFEAEGLKIECAQPYAEWRISFNGQLRNCIRKEDESYQGDNLFQVQLNLNWKKTASETFFWPLNWSSSLMADGIATEPWRDGKWANALNTPGTGGYDQFGQITGQVTIDNGNAIELDLSGIRQKRWELYCRPDLRRSASIIGVCDDGVIFSVGAASYREELTHVQFGNIQLQNGKTYPIDWTDFHIKNIAEHPDAVPKVISVNFIANKKHYKAVIYLQRDARINFLQADPCEWKISSCPTEFDINLGTGHGVAVLWYPQYSGVEKVGPLPEKKFKKFGRFGSSS